MLRIVVCVKAVPDPKVAVSLKIDPVTMVLPRSDIPLVINSLDQNALETALLLKEQEETFITVVSMGPPAAEKIVRECLALGADEGILLEDPAFAGADAYATAFTLANAVEKLLPVDVVICGMASSDGATEWVGPELATFLGFPVVTMVREFTKSIGKTWLVKADIKDGYRLLRVKLPVVFTVTRDVNTPRELSFSGIIKARRRDITTWGIEDLRLKETDVGLKGSPTIVTKMKPLQISRDVIMLEGDIEEKADRLITILNNAGVI